MAGFFTPPDEGGPSGGKSPRRPRDEDDDFGGKSSAVVGFGFSEFALLLEKKNDFYVKLKVHRKLLLNERLKITIFNHFVDGNFKDHFQIHSVQITECFCLSFYVKSKKANLYSM